MAEQNLANHPKYVPGYHYLTFTLLGIHLLWSLYRLGWGVPGVPVYDRLDTVIVAFALLLLGWYLRVFPLKAQDRVIRLEELLRLERLLPADLKARIGELRAGQLVALRFASDAELPELTRAVLDGKITDQGEIKKRVRSWRPDYLRM
jgi:hypothetical protein